MGVGSSKDLEDARAKLAAAEQRNQALSAEKAVLDQRLQAQADSLAKQQASLAEVVRSSKEKDAEVSKAQKQQQLAEELRRSDALLAKRLLHAQLRHFGGDVPEAPVAMDGSTMAAAMALSAQDELQLRQARRNARAHCCTSYSCPRSVLTLPMRTHRC